MLLPEEIARQTGMSVARVASVIGNMLDCVPYDDILNSTLIEL